MNYSKDKFLQNAIYWIIRLVQWFLTFASQRLP